MKSDEAPKNVQGQITKGSVQFVKEFELYSISIRKSFKYGDMIKSVCQEYYLQDVMELSGLLNSKYYDGLIESNTK